MLTEAASMIVDGNYLSKILLDLGVRADYARLTLAMAEACGLRLERVAYYDSRPHPKGEDRTFIDKRNKFLDGLSRLPGWTFVEGSTAFRGRTAEGKPIYVQKGVDVRLALDLVLETVVHKTSHTIILVAGDEDFLPALQEARTSGARAIVYHGGVDRRGYLQVSRRLLMAASEHHELTVDLASSCARS